MPKVINPEQAAELERLFKELEIASERAAASFHTGGKPLEGEALRRAEEADAKAGAIVRRIREIQDAARKSYGGRYGTYKDAVEIYEDGKHRRYSLLFAVNGAVAAIAKVAPHSAGADPVPSCFPDWLPDHWPFRLGMIAFTVLMSWDIWVFGKRIRADVGDAYGDSWSGIFSRVGKFVLLVCCALIIAGWAFVKSMPAFSGEG
jgi:hypothetical protein